ncbi:MAG: hypothetical protein KAS04_05635 [Candidatus Aenigmarchaeota archaeon]|nr:hypothetical protein [Candidatus Aenigmarchaeota archaeon]
MFKIWPFQEKELFLFYSAPRIDMFEKKDNLMGIIDNKLGQLKTGTDIPEKQSKLLGMKNSDNILKAEMKLGNDKPDMGGQFLRLMPQNILEHTKLGEKLFRRM